ncbi:MAG: glycosyltransferase family 39 protein [Chitinophagales bacterium]|jgi:4-amino-4-deoxy-L-arabinose transferase-like glycosyltransferase|nr:glycosyltransferase family 39 protein [Chitinophagales bacterium]
MLRIKNWFLRYPEVSIIAIVGVMTMPFLGHIHLFDWDEANFAELAREMIYSGNYLQPQINYLPFYEKPPLFIWFQVVSMKIFGINEFAARFPNALLGILNALTLYKIGLSLKNRRFGLYWSIVYTASLLPFLYFRSGLIDPWFNFFMFLSIYYAYHGFSGKWVWIFLSAMFLGFATQTKGPAAWIIVMTTIVLSLVKKLAFTWRLFFKLCLWVITSLILSSLWFAYETLNHGTIYLEEFIRYQIRLLTTEDALHGGPFYYHFVVLLFGCFPASFLLFEFKRYKEIFRDSNSNFSWIMAINGLWVLVLFSVVETKIIHYSSMAYYAISYFAAYMLYYRFGLNSEIEG